jgi:hypothetical protein
MPILDCQRRAYKKYMEKKKAEGTWKYYTKTVQCPICKKSHLNTNKNHHILTKYHNEALKTFIANNQPI